MLGLGDSPATVKRNVGRRGIGVELYIQRRGMRREIQPSLLTRRTVSRGRCVVGVEEVADLHAAPEK